MNTEWIITSLLVALTPVGVLSLVLLYKLATRAMTQTESMQRDHTMIVSELLASNTVKETGDQFTAGQMLGHSNAHDIRKHQPPIPKSFQPDMDELMGPHISPEVQYGMDDDEMTPPRPGEEV
jgi:hypothetical protein